MKILVLALTLAMGTSGCAAMMKNTPNSDWTPSKAPRCSESNGGIALDVIFTALYAAAAVAVAGDSGAAALGFGALGGLHVASAVSGHNGTKRCKEARSQHDDWIANRENSLERQRERAARGDSLDVEPGVADPVSNDNDDDETVFVEDNGYWTDFWREVRR